MCTLKLPFEFIWNFEKYTKNKMVKTKILWFVKLIIILF